MSGFGIISDKLDIKILILFILSRLPDKIDLAGLTGLVLLDGKVGYFDFAECLAELEKTGHVDNIGSAYLVTEKGVKNASLVESSLPYSIRERALEAIAPVANEMRRSAMIKTAHSQAPGGAVAELSLSDGIGEMLSIRLLVPGNDIASTVERHFRSDPEGIYDKIIKLLTE